MLRKTTLCWAMVLGIVILTVVIGGLAYSNSQGASLSTPFIITTPFGALWEDAQRRKTEGQPFRQSLEIPSLFQAQARVSYPIPLPEGVGVERVWVADEGTRMADPPVAIQFENDTLLILEKSQGTAPTELDKFAFPCKPVEVNGKAGIACDCEEAKRRLLEEKESSILGCVYQASVVWWDNGLFLTLYSDVVPLTTLLQMAETIRPPEMTTADPRHLLTILHADLLGYLQRGQIDASLKDSLESMIRATEKSLLEGKTDAALQQQEAFANEVQAQRGEKISEAAADDLIAQAQAIIFALSPALTPTSTEPTD